MGWCIPFSKVHTDSSSQQKSQTFKYIAIDLFAIVFVSHGFPGHSHE